MPMGTDIARGKHRGYGRLQFMDSIAWDLSTALFNRSFRMQDLVGDSPQGLAFRPDGLKLYFPGATNDLVYECDLTTAWDITTAVFLQSFSVAAQDTNPNGIYMRADGLRMYVSGSTNDRIYEYALGVAWDVTSAVFTGFFTIVQDTNPTGVVLRADGLKMYVTGSTNDNVYEYDLLVAWSVITAVFVQAFSTAAQTTTPRDIYMRADGLKMYVLGALNAAVYEYNLTVAWNISTAVFVQSIPVTESGNNPLGLTFKPDGLIMYVSQGTIGQYQL